MNEREQARVGQHPWSTSGKEGPCQSPAVVEACLAAIVESSDDAIIVKSLDGTILSWNAGAERIYGYAAAEAVGRNVSLLVPSQQADELRRILERIGQGERIECHEAVRVRKDGAHIVVSLVIVPLKDERGRVYGASTIARDITERKGTEAALRESEARHRAILEATIDGIITIDERGTILAANRATQRLFGYTVQELIGVNVKVLMPDPYHELHDGYLDNYRRTGQRKIIGIGREVVGRRKDGTVFPMDLSISEINVGGRRMFTGLVHDVTERKQAEEEASGGARRVGGSRPPEDCGIGTRQRRTGPGQGSRGGRQPGQERVPGQHEPRDTHAHERHHRYDRTSASKQPRPPPARLP